MAPEKDYTRYSFKITLLVIAVMLVVTLIPPFSVGGVRLKRANILSELITFEDAGYEGDGALNVPDMDFLDDLEGFEDTTEPGEALPEIPKEDTWQIGSQELSAQAEVYDERDVDWSGVVRIDDFTPEGEFSIADFSRMMAEQSGKKQIRIAFLGDSYIEGDIITCDIRAQLQELYGGTGTGFVPFSNTLDISRPTVGFTNNGWKSYSLVNKKTTPDDYKDNFFVSGSLNIPSDGAWTEYKGTGFKKGLYSWSRARVIFLNRGESVIDVAVNDSIQRRFNPSSGTQPQQITMTGGGMRSLKVTVSKADGFVGYGVVLDSGRGIALDNFSVRSNSGIALFGTDRATNTAIGRMLGYDLIVLQYGLNAMDPENTNYTAYGQQLRRVIGYIKSCFPGSTIIVMGVGDRSTRKDGEYVTMPAVEAMLKEQRAAAQATGVGFWNTYKAMGGYNSMVRFVENDWAAKDYTHMSYRGGREIANQFVKALRYAKYDTSRPAAEETFDRPSRTYDTQTVNLDMTKATDPGEMTVIPRDTTSIGGRTVAPARSDTLGNTTARPDATQRRDTTKHAVDSTRLFPGRRETPATPSDTAARREPEPAKRQDVDPYLDSIMRALNLEPLK